MEALLSLAFDSLSSFDGPKVRKGMRQVEGLLAQICLSSDTHGAGRQRRRGTNTSDTTDDENLNDDDDDENDGNGNGNTNINTNTQNQRASAAAAAAAAAAASSTPPRPKSLSRLSRDPAFREFFKLQEGFEWNVALRLIGALDRLMAKGSDGQNDILILGALDLIQGVLLLHPPSKALFAREQNMNLLLDLLEPFNCPAIQSATLLTLVVALVDYPLNTRTFEALDGLLTVTSLFKSRSTTREVKLKLVEFLYCYLLPETPSIPRASGASGGGLLQRSPSKLVGAFSRAAGSNYGNGYGYGHGLGGSGGSDGGGREVNMGTARRRRVTGGFGGGVGAGSSGAGSEVTLSTEEKQELLSRHLSSVEDLVKDLRNCAPFGGVVC